MSGNQPIDSSAAVLQLSERGTLALRRPLGASGDREVTALFAGQSAALARDTTAAELVQSLAEETTRRLRALNPREE